jgi:hypothetical protein
MTRQSHPDPEIDELFRQLRELREAYECGEVDSEGNPTAFGRLVSHAKPVNQS